MPTGIRNADKEEPKMERTFFNKIYTPLTGATRLGIWLKNSTRLSVDGQIIIDMSMPVRPSVILIVAFSRIYGTGHVKGTKKKGKGGLGRNTFVNTEILPGLSLPPRSPIWVVRILSICWELVQLRRNHMLKYGHWQIHIAINGTNIFKAGRRKRTWFSPQWNASPNDL